MTGITLATKAKNEVLHLCDLDPMVRSLPPNPDQGAILLFDQTVQELVLLMVI
tara:strand:+ start:2094 stop:2252 length:159 start_codon:yes stop_codon:yes gene_type:complete